MGCSCSQDGKELQTYAGDTRSPEELANAGWPGKTLNEESRYPGFIVDLPWCLLFLVFWVGMIVIAAIGFDQGNPYRLIYGEDYQGKLCGEDTEPAGWSAAISACRAAGSCPFQSSSWSENKYIWYPFPYDGDLEAKTDAGTVSTADSQTYYSGTFVNNLDANTAVKSGVCVHECPTYGWRDSNGTANSVQSAFGGSTALSVVLSNLNKVYAYGTGPGGQRVAHPWFFVWYNSSPRFRRCINEDGAAYLADGMLGLADALPSSAGIDDVWQNALADLERSWKVLAICGAFAIIAPFVFCMLMRICLGCIVYSMMFLAWIVMIGGGVMCYSTYTELSDDDFGDNDGEAKVWLAGAILLWLGAIIFALVVCCMWKKIKIAIAVIKEASRVLAADPTLIFVPILTAIAVLCVMAWCIVVWLYVYTIVEEDAATPAASPEAAPASTVAYVLASVDDKTTVTNMIYYNFFGFLWTIGVLNGIGFFVIAGATVKWYYSHRISDEKHLTCCFGWMGCYCWAFIHIGGIACGTLLVAIIQFIRFLVYQFCEQFKEKEIQIIHCIVQCCLGCLERFLQYITKNTYVVMAIDGGGFWCSACKMFGILIDNFFMMVWASILGDIVFGFGKIVVVGCNCYLCWSLLKEDELASDVDNGWFVCIIVGLTTLIISALFFHVFEVATDAMVILVAREMSMVMDGKLTYDDVAMGDSVYEACTGRSRDASNWEEHIAKMREGRDARLGKPSTEPAG